MSEEAKNKFEQNIKTICEKSENMGAGSLEIEDVEKVLRLFEPETVAVIRTIAECFEFLSKKIDNL